MTGYEAPDPRHAREVEGGEESLRVTVPVALRGIERAGAGR